MRLGALLVVALLAAGACRAGEAEDEGGAGPAGLPPMKPSAVPGPDFPSERVEYQLSLERSGDGHVRPDGLAAALAARAAAPVAPWVSPWQWLGPGNIGGRIRAMAIHPTRPDTVWIGSAGGGIWKTTDGGRSWRALDDFMGSLSVSALALDPRDPDTLLAGTGEGFFRAHRGVRGIGIMVSRDGGKRWAHLSSTAGPEFGFVNRLAFSADGAKLFAATREGLYVTADRGASWRVAPGTAGREVLDLDPHPRDPARIVAGGAAADVLASRDGGASFEAARGLPEPDDPRASVRVETCWAAADPDLVYASVDLGGGRIMRSRDGGRSFAPVAGLEAAATPPAPAAYLGGQGWYDNVIWAGDPVDPGLLVVGGIDLWRSRDGGATLARISRWEHAPRSAHADHHAILAYPGYDGTRTRRVLFGNDGGVYRTDDVAAVEPLAGWSCLNENLGITQLYRASENPRTGTILGGTQDHGTLRAVPGAGPQEWTQTITGDGGWLAWDPADPDGRFYGEYVFATAQRMEADGTRAEFICGLHWDGVKWSFKPEPFSITDAAKLQANFIAPLYLDPARPSRLLVGARSLWLSEDPEAEQTPESGPHWRRIKRGLGPEDRRDMISAIGMDATRPGEIWVGHNLGEVFVTRDGYAPEPRWEAVSAGAGARRPLPRRMCTALLPDPGDPAHTLAAFGGFEPGNVWETRDGGGTWTARAAGLPPCPVLDLAIHPARPGHWYAGTAVGLYASRDGGASWAAAPGGPAVTPVTQLFWSRARVTPGAGPDEGPALAAVTFGRGVWVTVP